MKIRSLLSVVLLLSCGAAICQETSKRGYYEELLQAKTFNVNDNRVQYACFADEDTDGYFFTFFKLPMTPPGEVIPGVVVITKSTLMVQAFNHGINRGVQLWELGDEGYEHAFTGYAGKPALATFIVSWQTLRFQQLFTAEDVKDYSHFGKCEVIPFIK